MPTMSTPGQPVEWKRLLVEGVVILASILLAFAIDAWWDNRQEQQVERRQLLSIVTELESNADRVRKKLNTLTAADAAARKLLSWMGPEPQSVAYEEFSETFTAMYTIGAFALLTGASENYLFGARIEAVNHDDARKAVAEWYAAGDALEKQWSWLRESHTDLGEYLTDAVPRLRIDSSHPLMQDVQVSRFPFDLAGLLADPKFESRISVLLIRIRFVKAQGAGLLDEQAQLTQLIQSAAEG